MTFENLPNNWPDLPLDDPDLRADVVDLVVSYRDRLAGCLALLALDEVHLIMGEPIVIAEMGERGPADVHEVLTALFEHGRPPGLVAALGRPGPPRFTDGDRELHQALVEVCRAQEVELIATYVASESAVRELPDHLRLAS
ncbi:hypothetical protein N802_15265 [Knoellia sinensis KCTC 19936]|uniref:Uncharacterized protein n=1 Tax=Knoellia sinensis KCTC 19936 TaxID=1385520 RepID=A0A0A0J8C7_9MICO|nr:hypothetical protein [Knoellia sinensis]KGN33413.1 hypothetical protein N802_15265 [Knoellia sinensis KCTC 19936]